MLIPLVYGERHGTKFSAKDTLSDKQWLSGHHRKGKGTPSSIIKRNISMSFTIKSILGGEFGPEPKFTYTKIGFVGLIGSFRY
jgi:hypothetical protein